MKLWAPRHTSYPSSTHADHESSLLPAAHRWGLLCQEKHSTLERKTCAILNPSHSPALPLSTLWTDASWRFKQEANDRASNCSVSRACAPVISNLTDLAAACTGQRRQNEHQRCYQAASTTVFHSSSCVAEAFSEHSLENVQGYKHNPKTRKPNPLSFIKICLNPHI